MIDIDNSGTITHKELKIGLKKVGSEMMEAGIKSLIGAAICKYEGVEKFDELELGPFLKHQFVKHYFSLSKEVEEVYKITSEEVVSHLSLYLYKKHKNVVIEEFMDFVAKKCKVTSPTVLGLRIQNLGITQANCGWRITKLE